MLPPRCPQSRVRRGRPSRAGSAGALDTPQVPGQASARDASLAEERPHPVTAPETKTYALPPYAMQLTCVLADWGPRRAGRYGSHPLWGASARSRRGSMRSDVRVDARPGFDPLGQGVQVARCQTGSRVGLYPVAGAGEHFDGQWRPAVAVRVARRGAEQPDAVGDRYSFVRAAEITRCGPLSRRVSGMGSWSWLRLRNSHQRSSTPDQ